MARAKTSPAAAPEIQPEPIAAPALIEARVLATGAFGQIDDVVALTPELLAQGLAAGQVDPNPDAVAYAKALR